MDFATAWTLFAVGDYVAVSNGLPEPSVHDGRPWKLWRSHNFIGILTAKNSGPPRTMSFTLAKSGTATVQYTVSEGIGHSFSSSNYDDFSGG